MTPTEVGVRLASPPCDAPATVMCDNYSDSTPALSPSVIPTRIEIVGRVLSQRLVQSAGVEMAQGTRVANAGGRGRCHSRAALRVRRSSKQLHYVPRRPPASHQRMKCHFDTDLSCTAVSIEGSRHLLGLLGSRPRLPRHSAACPQTITCSGRPGCRGHKLTWRIAATQKLGGDRATEPRRACRWRLGGGSRRGRRPCAQRE